MHTPAGAGVTLEREGTRAGHQYNLLGKIAGSADVTVEPYLISLTTSSDVFPAFQHQDTLAGNELPPERGRIHDLARR